MADLPASTTILAGGGGSSAERMRVLRQEDPEFDQAMSLLATEGAASAQAPAGSRVALILKEHGADRAMLVAAILSDPRLHEHMESGDLARQFSAEVVHLAGSVRLLNAYQRGGQEALDRPQQAERLRRMLLAVVEDARAVIIALAWQLEYLLQLTEADEELRQRAARETLEIQAPLANRLGLARFKWELEDLAFRFLEPATYQELVHLLESSREQRERYIEQFKETLRAALTREGISATVSGRPKHLYSIWRKMQAKGRAFQDLRDLLAVRVIVRTVADCYAALGVVHSLWKHIPREFDDYIANRKKNGYQSLHTAVIGPDDQAVEVQVRTEEMHAIAELGIAAHWSYKESAKAAADLNRQIATFRQLLDHAEDSTPVEDLHGEAFADRVFVLTPRGQVVELPRGATPLDFAYAVHTDIGHRCRGAKVNGKIVPLTQELENGERVEILTAKNQQPSRDWMNPGYGYLASQRARSKVRAWFKQRDFDQNVREGKTLLEGGIGPLSKSHLDHDEIARHFKLKDAQELYASLGWGDLHLGPVVAYVKGTQRAADVRHAPLAESSRSSQKSSASPVRIMGAGSLLTQLARCCRPAPGEAIGGYITKAKGVSIHRADCANLRRLIVAQPNRAMDVEWGVSDRTYPVEVRIEAYDRQGLLRDITAVISHEKINVVRADTHTDRETQSVRMDLTLEVRDTTELSRVLERVAQVKQVYSARRRRSS